MITDEQMISGWYGNIAPGNDDQRRFMLDTGHLFEMHSVEKVITDENVLKEIRTKYPASKLFSDKFLGNTELLKKFRAHLSGMGLEPQPEANLATNARVSIKLAHIIYPTPEFKSEQEQAKQQIDDYFASDNRNGSDNAASSSNATKPATEPQPTTNDNITNSELLSLQTSISILATQLEKQQLEFSKQLQLIQSQMQQQNSMEPRTTQITRSTNNELTDNSNRIEQDGGSAAPSEIRVSTYSNRTHHDIAQRFKNGDCKYGGTDDEDLFEFLITYETTAEDYEMSDEQKCRYIHNLFKEEALRFYNSNVRPNASSYMEAKKLMLLHFNSPDVQARVKNELLSIKFETFINKEGSKPKALSAMASHIANRSRKCPPAYSHESHRVEFLKKALMKEEWAKVILLEVNETTNYQQLYTRLANALQFHEESTADTENETKKPSNKPMIYFTQPKYGRKLTGRLFSGSSHDKTCWNCDKAGHRHTDCRKKHDPVRIAAAKARFLEKKSRFQRPGMSPAKQVLFELTEELRDLVGGEPHSDSDNPADTFFGNAPDDSDDESTGSETHQDMTMEELFSMSLDEQGF